MDSVKQIIDKHITANYDYYRVVCRRKYSDSYLAEDLLHELYVCLTNTKNEIILNYYKKNNLKVLCFNLIKRIFEKRFQVLFHVDGKTSPLHESKDCYVDVTTNGIDLDYELIGKSNAVYTLEAKDIDINELIKRDEQYESLELIKQEVFDAVTRIQRRGDIKNISDKDFDLAVFCCSQNEPITQISKRTGINRISLANSRDRALLRFKKTINDSRRNNPHQ